MFQESEPRAKVKTTRLAARPRSYAGSNSGLASVRCVAQDARVLQRSIALETWKDMGGRKEHEEGGTWRACT
eukprot:6138591-Pyramimonas_sp.AAC.1